MNHQPGSSKGLPSGGVPGRLDLAPDGTDEQQLAEWEAACLGDMRKALSAAVTRNGSAELPVRIRRFEI
jgi:hypothetical protein